ncbi:MAG: hypothetical protein NT007_04640 [Candidatus Kapabacteria bacterium]|nr:hypothetical protein [Candidatus Kapabacteria bacterium]
MKTTLTFAICIVVFFNTGNLYPAVQQWRFFTFENNTYPSNQGFDRILISPKDSITVLEPSSPKSGYKYKANKWVQFDEVYEGYGNGNHYSFNDILYDKDTTYYLTNYSVLKTYYSVFYKEKLFVNEIKYPDSIDHKWNFRSFIKKGNDIWIIRYSKDTYHLIKLTDTTFIKYDSIMTGINGPIWGWFDEIKKDNKGNLYLLSPKGLVKFNGATSTIYDSTRIPMTNYYDRISCFNINKNGDLWFKLHHFYGKNDSLFYISGDSVMYYNLSSKPIGKWVFDMCWDSLGNTWFASDSCLARFDGANWTTFTPQNSPLPLFCIGPLACDSKNNLWLGISGEGMNKPGIGIFNPNGLTGDRSGVNELFGGGIQRNASPNPTDGSVTFQFELPKPSPVEIRIIDDTGTTVALIPAQNYQTGENSYTFNGNLPNGAYNYFLNVNDCYFSGRFVVVR